MNIFKKYLAIIIAVTVFITGFGILPTTIVNADMVTVSDWETLKSALESGETVIMLRGEEPIVATSDIKVVLGENTTVWIFSAEGKDVISMNYTNFGIHVSGNGVLRLENIPFNNYSNPCIINEDSDNVDVNIKNCGFYNGDGEAINGHYTEAKMLQSEEITGKPKIDSEPETISINGTNIFNTALDIETENSLTIGDTLVANFTLDNINATGKVMVDVYDSIGENTYNRKIIPIENGTASALFSNLTVGNHTITATYGGDSYHLPSIDSRVIEVLKRNSDTKVSAADITSGETEIIAVDVTGVEEELSGDVIVGIYKNNSTVFNNTLNVVNGIAVLPIDNLTTGYYRVIAQYQENEIYYGSKDETEFWVNNGTYVMPAGKVKTQISVGMNSTIEYGETQMLHYQVGDNFTAGKVVIDVTDVARSENCYNRVVPVNNGTADVLFGTMPAGNYSMRAIYGGDENHQAAINYSNLTINKAESMINVSATDYVYGKTGYITVDVADAKGNNITGDVNIDIFSGGRSIINNTVNVLNGTAKIPINALKEGKYTVQARYAGDGNYLSCDGKTLFTVLKATVAKPKKKTNDITSFKKKKPVVKRARKKNNKKKITVILKKKIKDANGYIVKFYTGKKKNGKVVFKKTIKSNRLKFTISGKKLKKFNKLFIRVQAYKKISNKRYVSLMSKIKKVKVKK